MKDPNAQNDPVAYWSNRGKTELWQTKFCTAQLKQIMTTFKLNLVSGHLTDMKAAGTLMARAAAAIGPIHLLVNSASIFEEDFGSDPDFAIWDRHFAIHLKAPALLAARLAAALPDDGEGLVVNVIDQRVWKLTPQYFSYTLSKSALWTATRTLAQALQRAHVLRVVAAAAELVQAAPDAPGA